MDNNTYKIYESDDIGEVRVTEDVLAIIAGLAATEVEGVSALAGNITSEIISKLGRKILAAGVNVAVTDGEVMVSLSLVVEMGYSIPEISKNVQAKVKDTIEGMTGMKVSGVDIAVSNINIED